MEKVTKKNIAHYLQTTYGLESASQLFSDDISSEKQQKIIDQFFYYFAQHEIHSEGNMLTARNDTTEQVKTYYYEIHNYNHIKNFEQLTSELEAAQNVTRSIQEYNRQVIRHRGKADKRLNEIHYNKAIQYNLEPEH